MRINRTAIAFASCFAIFGACKTTSDSKLLQNPGPGPVTPPANVNVTCRTDFSGAFLRGFADTTIYCTVTGKGALAWRATAVVQGQERAIGGWSGRVNENLDTQQFVAPQIRVDQGNGGPLASYNVYLTTLQGAEKVRWQSNGTTGPLTNNFQAVSGQCFQNTGGGFFDPKTYVTCKVQGTGAMSYKITINGSQMIPDGTAVWSGNFTNPRDEEQLINTDSNKQQVGPNGNTVLHVIVIGTDGVEKEVASFPVTR